MIQKFQIFRCNVVNHKFPVFTITIIASRIFALRNFMDSH